MSATFHALSASKAERVFLGAEHETMTNAQQKRDRRYKMRRSRLDFRFAGCTYPGCDRVGRVRLLMSCGRAVAFCDMHALYLHSPRDADRPRKDERKDENELSR